MGKKISIAIFIIVSFIALDIFSRFLYAQSWFGNTSFAKEVNPLDIITLVISTSVTIWLGIYISKKLTEQRYQKEYIINDIKLIEEEIVFFDRNTMQSSSLDLQPTVNVLNKLKSYIDRFSKSLEIFNISIDIKLLNSGFNNLYTKVTNTSGSSLILDDTNKHEIASICNDLVLVTRKIVCSINKH